MNPVRPKRLPDGETQVSADVGAIIERLVLIPAQILAHRLLGIALAVHERRSVPVFRIVGVDGEVPVRASKAVQARFQMNLEGARIRAAAGRRPGAVPGHITPGVEAAADSVPFVVAASAESRVRGSEHRHRHHHCHCRHATLHLEPFRSASSSEISCPARLRR